MNIYDSLMTPLEKRILAEIRGNVIPIASGDVLEIGYGTGVNFKYYNSGIIKCISAMDVRPSLTVNKTEHLPIKFYKGKAEKLPFENETFDTVVETLVFCSVEDISKAISEIRRVLKPGGTFIFIDHVKPEQRKLAAFFKTANVFWSKIAGGCNLTRESHKLIESSGFTIEQSGSSGHGIFRWGVAKK